MVTYPIEWKEYTIGDITRTVITGGTPSTARQEYYGGNIPWLSSTEIHQKRIKKPTTYITDFGLQNSSAKIAPERSVLIALAGQGKTRGTAAYLTRPMALNQSLAALVNNEKSNPEYLYYLIDSMYLPLRELSSGDGGRGGLNKKLIKDVTVTIPVDIAEQKDIAETLQSFDTYISDLAELIEKKRGIRDGAINDLLSATTRLAGFDKPWKKTTLGKEYVVIMGQSPNSVSYNSSGIGVPLVQGNADIEGRVTAPKRHTSMPIKICENGDTILAVRAPVGTASRANQRVCLGRGVCAISGMHKDFIYYLMRYYESAWEVIEQGSTFTSVSGKEVRNFEIKIPEEGEEQDAISRILIAMDEEIEALEIERDKMIQIREGAMDDLLTGRVRLKGTVV